MSEKNRLDYLFERTKNHPKVSVFLFVGFALICLGTFTESLEKIISFGNKYILTPIIDVVGSNNIDSSQTNNTIQTEERKLILREKSARELLEALEALPPLQAEQIIKQSYIGRWVRWEGIFYTLKSAEDYDKKTEFHVYVCHPDGNPPWIGIIFSGKSRFELEQLRKGDHIQFEAKINQIGNMGQIGIYLSEGKLLKN